MIPSNHDSLHLFTHTHRVFTFCFAIIDVVVFIQPQWIGDTVESKGTGYFGLWKHCSLVQGGQEIICKGQLEDFSTILNPAFRAATIFVGLSVIIITLCLFAMLFFFFFSSSTVFHVCGWLQMCSGDLCEPDFCFCTRHKQVQWPSESTSRCSCVCIGRFPLGSTSMGFFQNYSS